MREQDAAKKKKETQALVEQLLSLLGLQAKAKVKIEKEAVKIEIEGEDLGPLIGYKGENLESLQLFLGLALNKTWGEGSWTPVLVDAGGWRREQEKSLRAFLTKELATLSEDRPTLELPPMPPAQRRLTHLLVGEFENLTSESVGEEPNRHVVIKRVEKR